jgi:uncharacterized membrane protein YeaQ/YmgE (transglycosylase-associated protein family)
MDFAIAIGIGGLVLLIVGALVVGGIAQFLGDVETGYEWVFTAAGAFVGGLAASEWILGLRTTEPVWDGLALVPALLGGLIVGVIVDAFVRYSTGGSYTPGHVTA